MSDYTQVLEIIEEHLPVPPQDGPGYCRGCDWESRPIGISSHIQHRQHVAKVLADEFRNDKAAGWDEGRDEALAAWHIDHTDPHAHLDPNPYRSNDA